MSGTTIHRKSQLRLFSAQLQPVARILTVAPLLALALTVVGCQGAPAPLRPTATTMRGLKARVFPNKPEAVFEAVRVALVDRGFVLREDGVERGFIHAHTIRSDYENHSGDPLEPARWTRVTARIEFVDKHRRAPRTLLELEGESMQHRSDGTIEAGFGDMGTQFYDELFQDVQSRLPRPALPQLALPGFE